MRGLPNADLAEALLSGVRPAVQTETLVVERGRYRTKHRHTEPQLCPLKAAACVSSAGAPGRGGNRRRACPKSDCEWPKRG